MVYLFGILSTLALVLVVRSLLGYEEYLSSSFGDRLIVALLWSGIAIDFIANTLKALGN